MLADAAEAGDIRQNPARGVRTGSLTSAQTDERAKALTRDEAAELVATLPQQHRLLVRFLLETGMRISEASAITWGDVKFADGRVAVERRYRNGRTGPPRSAAGRRRVPLSDTLARRLGEARRDSADASDDGAGLHRAQWWLLGRDECGALVQRRCEDGRFAVGDAALLSAYLC
jgi:integrase